MHVGSVSYAPLHALFLDPYLPPWLPEITVSNLHVGDAVVAIRFYREHDGKSDYEVLEERGHLHVVRQPSPWSLTAGPVERMSMFLKALSQKDKELRPARIPSPAFDKVGDEGGKYQY